VENLLPNATMLNSLGGVINWRVPKDGVVVSQVFAEMESNKQRLRIDDWGICNTTLEEVFHSIVADDINDALEIEDVESDGHILPNSSFKVFVSCDHWTLLRLSLPSQQAKVDAPLK